MRYLTIALTKGRLAEKTLEMLEQLGITCEEMKEKDSRKLVFVNEELKLKFFLAKGPDVPTYVEYGAADIGVVGKDTIVEEGRNVHEVLDLGFGKCRMCVCGPADAKKYLEAKGIECVEKTGTTNDEISLGADALIAAGCEAVFTPTDNTVMTAELAIFEKFADAGIPHYTSADSFALNGAFLGYGVNYETLGTKTADMVADILANGADPATTPVETLDSGIVTVNTEIAEKVGIDYSIFKDMCSELIETVTAEEFN